eukprot:scaffold323_cov94-Isochrysis_galbana.AAC.4
MPCGDAHRSLHDPRAALHSRPLSSTPRCHGRGRTATCRLSSRESTSAGRVRLGPAESPGWGQGEEAARGPQAAGRWSHGGVRVGWRCPPGAVRAGVARLDKRVHVLRPRGAALPPRRLLLLLLLVRLVLALLVVVVRVALPQEAERQLAPPLGVRLLHAEGVVALQNTPAVVPVRALAHGAERHPLTLVRVQLEQPPGRVLDEQHLQLLERLRQDLVQREEDVRVGAEQSPQDVFVRRRLQLGLHQLSERRQKGPVQVAASLLLELGDGLPARLLLGRAGRQRADAVLNGAVVARGLRRLAGHLARGRQPVQHDVVQPDEDVQRHRVALLGRPRLARRLVLAVLGRHDDQRLGAAGRGCGARGAGRLQFGAAEEGPDQRVPESGHAAADLGFGDEGEGELGREGHQAERLVVDGRERLADLEGQVQRPVGRGRLGRPRRRRPLGLVAVGLLLALGQRLELQHHLLAREVLLVALLEVEGAVVERLCPVLLVHLLPALAQAGALRPPFGIFLLQPAGHLRDGRRRALEQQLNHLGALRAVQPAERLAVHGR